MAVFDLGSILRSYEAHKQTTDADDYDYSHGSSGLTYQDECINVLAKECMDNERKLAKLTKEVRELRQVISAVNQARLA